MNRLFVTTLLCLLGSALSLPAAFAQTGTIAGTIVDSENGETLIGVNVIVEGTATGAATDIDGAFAIPDLAPGSYNLMATYIGYNPITIQEVEVTAGETTRLDFTMTPDAVAMEELVVEARALQNTEASLLRDRQKSAAVSDAISAEAISRSGSGDAASAMTKVTGASVVGGRYVYIRGLGDRYSSTQLNGAELPSADPDRKSFQLDLFPSNLLDNIVTTKTFTPDKPGNFSGGLVNVGTKDFPEQLTFRVSTSLSYNTQTTFSDDLLLYDGSDTDWLGFDDGLREIPNAVENISPDDIPRANQARTDTDLATELDDLTRSFNTVMTPTMQDAPVDRSLSISVGNQISLFGRPLGFTGSLTYGQNYSAYTDGVVGRWELIGGQVSGVNELTQIRFFGDDLGTDIRGSAETNWGALGTLAYKFHPRHSTSVTFLRTQSGISEARYLNGFWEDIGESSVYETRVMGYKERSLSSLQFKGEHSLPFLTAEWKASVASNAQDEPDLRYFTNHFTIRDIDRDGMLDSLYQQPASLYPRPVRFFRDLEETNLNGTLDITVPFNQWNGLGSRFKFGASYLDVDRDFQERRFEYQQGPGFNYREFEGDDEAFFDAVGIIDVDTTSRGDLRYNFGNYISEASSPRNNYDAERTILAGYLMLDMPLTQRLRFIGGVRVEDTDITTVSGDSTLPEGILDNTDWLPSVNLVYQLNDQMNVRAAATQTLARPTFRELAPYATFDFVGDFVFFGNSSLERTLITNYDLRWEWFVRPGEILAVSGFYKDFENPLERVILTSAGNNSMSIQNVESGRVMGLEVEARKRLDVFSERLANFQIGGNFSLVDSRVNIPEEELTVIRAADPDADDTRALQGQSPYLVNLDLAYENFESGTSVSLFYNIFGERLITVTEGAAPDVFERPRATLDFVASQQFLRGFSVKLSAKNLLDTAVRQSQIFRDVEYIYAENLLGRTFSLGVSYGL